MNDMSELVSREERTKLKVEFGCDDWKAGSRSAIIKRLLATLDAKDGEIALLESSLEDCKCGLVRIDWSSE